MTSSDVEYQKQGSSGRNLLTKARFLRFTIAAAIHYDLEITLI